MIKFYSLLSKGRTYFCNLRVDFFCDFPLILALLFKKQYDNICRCTKHVIYGGRWVLVCPLVFKTSVWG
jgi:hypothetical protein